MSVRAWLMIAAIGAAWLPWSGAAVAQTSMRLERDFLLDRSSPEARVRVEDMRATAEMLGLDAAQCEALEDLWRSYDERYREGKRRWDEYQRKLNMWMMSEGMLHGGGGSGVPGGDNDATAAYQAFNRGLRENFFADVRLLLRAEQEGAWARLERHQERLQLMTWRSPHDVVVDVTPVAAAAMDGEPLPAEAGAILERFESESLALLREHNQKQRANQEAWSAATSKGTDPNEATAQAQREIAELSLRIRELSQSTAERIAVLLPPMARADLLRETYEQLVYGGYMVRRQGSGDANSMDWVRDRRDLTAEQRAKLEEIAVGYAADLSRAYQPRIKKTNDEMREQAPQTPTGGVTDWEFSKQVLEMRDRLNDRLRAILTPEQLAEAPRPLNNALPEVPVFEEEPSAP